MSNFNLEAALAANTRLIAERAKTRATSYVLYFSNNDKRYEGKLEGSTVKSLIAQFRTSRGTYKYAFITKLNDDKVLRFYNRDLSSKFFSMTRKGGPRSKKN